MRDTKFPTVLSHFVQRTMFLSESVHTAYSGTALGDHPKILSDNST